MKNSTSTLEYWVKNILEIIKKRIIIDALITDADNPDIIQNNIINKDVIINLVILPLKYASGNKNHKIIIYIIPVWSPLKARICDNPAFEKLFLLSRSIFVLSPNVIALKNALLFSFSDIASFDCLI